ncbi:MAG: GNAT family N-acetyltransferase [Candidatus Kariarchaeaceae archaeon]
MRDQVDVYPLTPDRWGDLRDLFGPSGAYWNCWCMYWRFTNKEFTKASKENKIIALKSIVDQEIHTPGLLAYMNDKPVGWCGISPRNTFDRLVKSRVIKSVDDKPVWSIVCFFIHKDFRGLGVASGLIRGAIKYCNDIRIPAIESYPVDLDQEQIDPNLAYVGTVSMFEKAGFVEIGMTKAKCAGRYRKIMRYTFE